MELYKSRAGYGLNPIYFVIVELEPRYMRRLESVAVRFLQENFRDEYLRHLGLPKLPTAE